MSLVGLLTATLLAGCDDDNGPTATPVSASASNGAVVPTPSRPAQGQGNGTPGPSTKAQNGPVVGQNGQITVVAPPPNGQNINGQIFWVKENNIWQGGAGTTGGAPFTKSDLGGKQLTKASDLAMSQSPTVSPDGLTMIYAYSPEPEGTPGNVVIGQDLYQYDLKTGTNSLLIKRDDPQGFLDHPAYSADGKYLYYESRTYRRDKDNQIIGEVYTLYRYSLATKQREKLIEDAREANPLPDGKHLVFTSVLTQQNYQQELKVLDLDTKEVRSLAGQDKGFVATYFSRSSPDGQLIAFAGAGGPDDPASFGSNSGPAQPTPTKATGLLNGPLGLIGLLPLSKATVARHGVPYDLWVIKPDGSGLRRLTTLYEDQPMAAWSKDGKLLAFLAGQGFYTINVDGTNLIKKSDRGGHGGFVWYNN